VWGIGPIKEWRMVATNISELADQVDRGGMAALFLSPDGKTVLIWTGFGGVQVVDAFTL
jgi:hypothetical protein